MDFITKPPVDNSISRYWNIFPSHPDIYRREFINSALCDCHYPRCWITSCILRKRWPAIALAWRPPGQRRAVIASPGPDLSIRVCVFVYMFVLKCTVLAYLLINSRLAPRRLGNYFHISGRRSELLALPLQPRPLGKSPRQLFFPGPRLHTYTHLDPGTLTSG